ncbi:MAG: type I-E CRISPR-associated protein Cse1/CasA [Planctomycetes bacterium]|nr:type I-E CRISPR-associated protein Cse1/CasA [Planctomycetota bacterium]
MNYNLLDEPWIPVLASDGSVRRVGIRDALTQAGVIRQIAASNPMDRVAILRFLLAVLYWCRGNPPKSVEATCGDSFPAEWFSKLEASKDCFNLLGDGKRFYQRFKSVEKLAADYLIHEVPTGTNKWHFHHATDKVDGLCPACCAMGLLRLPLFATSGGRGKPPGINSKPPFYVIPVGPSLAATLRLSWLHVTNLGTPTWEGPDVKSPKMGEVSLLMGLTWLPRSVWLDDPEEPEARCISCGRRKRLIRRCAFAGIGSMKPDEGSPGLIWRDPHVIYVTTRKGDVMSLRAANVLKNPARGAGQWAEVAAGVLNHQQATAAGETTNYTRRAWVVGFATVQNDKYLEALEGLISFPNSIVGQQIPDTVERIERWRKEGSALVRRTKPRSKKGKKGVVRKHVEIRPLVAAVRPHVEHKVSAHAGELIAGAEESWQQAAREYGPMMRAVARSLSPGFTTEALQRRREIARVLPDMSVKAKSDKKPGRKKGGDM